MLTKIQKWGNSHAIRIPKAFADEMQIGVGSDVELTIEKGKLVIAAVEPKPYSLEELLAAVTPENIHGEADWGKPVGKEAW